MRRNVWVRNTEVALLLPATLVLAPLAAFAGLGMAFAVVQQKFLIAVGMLFILLLAFLVGLLGLACAALRNLELRSDYFGDMCIAPGSGHKPVTSREPGREQPPTTFHLLVWRRRTGIFVTIV